MAGTLVLCVGLAGCSSVLDDPSLPSDDATAAEDVAGGSPRARASTHPTAEPSPTPGGTRRAEPTHANMEGQRGSRPGGPRERSESGNKEGPPALAGAPSSSRSDPRADGDSSGERPGYVDIRRATIAGSKRTVSFAIRVAGAIPRPLEERGSNMTASFRLDMPDGSTHNIYAIGDDRGWRAEFDGGSFPGRFSIAGDVFVWDLHSGAIGARRFRWFAQTAWTRSASGPLGETDYYFDRVPEFEAANYPE